MMKSCSTHSTLRKSTTKKYIKLDIYYKNVTTINVWCDGPMIKVHIIIIILHQGQGQNVW